MTNVARPGIGLIRLASGQRLGGAAAMPGVFSYDQRNNRAAGTKTNHRKIENRMTKRRLLVVSGTSQSSSGTSLPKCLNQGLVTRQLLLFHAICVESRGKHIAKVTLRYED